MTAQDTTALAVTDPDPVVAMIERACTNSDFDADKLSQLMDLKERQDAKAAKERFGEAVAAFQGRCPAIHKGRTIDMGRGAGPAFASYDDIMRVIQPLLTELRLSVSFDTAVNEGGMLTSTCRVSGFGHTESNSVTLPVPGNMKVNDTQKMGAANSYAKRYALVNALNIVVTDEDTDAVGLAAVTGLDDKQAVGVQALLEQLTAADQGKFWAWLAVKPGDYWAIPAARYAEVCDKLRSKIGGAA